MFPGEWNNGSIGNSTLKSLNIKLWFTIYSFHVETTTIHFLVPNSTKNHQECIIWSIASTCKENFQYKTMGGEILVPRYWKLQAIVGVAIIAMFSGRFWSKNHLLIPLCCWDMAWKLGWNLLKVVSLLLQKLGRIFWVSGKCGLERTRIRTRTRTRRHQYYDTEMVVTMAVCSVLKPRGALTETS